MDSPPPLGFAEYLRTTYPTNNATEQALRGIVLKRKISGTTRSRRGDEFIACGFGTYETCRRQEFDLIDYLHSAVCMNRQDGPRPA